MNWLWSSRRKFLSILPSLKYSMAPFSPVTHVIFDLDGTILDTETLHAETYTTVFEHYGSSYSDEIRLAITGTKESDTIRLMLEKSGLDVPIDEFTERVHKLQEKVLPHSQFKPGAEKLIRHLHKNNVPLAIATSSGEEKCKLKMAKYQDLFSCFHHMVKGSSDPEVINGKPAPDIFLICASRFSPPADPAKCLVFEDAVNGVLGGKAAGMQVVMIPEDYVPLEKTKDADLVIKSLEDFKPEDFGLPPYN